MIDEKMKFQHRVVLSSVLWMTIYMRQHTIT